MKPIYTAAMLAAEGVLADFPARNLRHGDVALANDTFFTMGNYNRFLTDFAVQYRDPSDLQAELDFLAPPKMEDRRFTFDVYENDQAFAIDAADSDLRGIGAAFGKVENLRTTETAGLTYNKGLSMVIDDDRIGSKNQTWREDAIAHLRQRLLRLDLRRAVTLLNAAAVSTGYIWDKADGVDPDMDIQTEITSAGNISGVNPNSVHFSNDAWIAREATYRAHNNAGGTLTVPMSVQALAGSRMLERGYVSKARYASATNTKSTFVSLQVLLFFALDNPNFTPQNSINFWSPCKSGERFMAYLQDMGKFHVVTLEHYSRPTITSTLGIRKLAITT